MAELLRDGSIRMRDGRILWGRDVVQIIDVLELSKLLVPAPKSFGGGFGGGGRGAQGLPGPTGTQGLPGIISLVQDEGFNLPLQNTLNFIGSSVSVFNDPGNGRLNITVDDTRAATFVVGPDHADYPMTEAGLIAAIAALPAAGGEIYIREGTLAITDTIALGDKDITLSFSSGATLVATGLGAKPMFKINNVITARRQVIFENPSCVGENLASAQYLFEYADSTSLMKVTFRDAYITGFRRLLNISASDLTYIVPTRIYFESSSIIPPVAASTLVSTPGPAGTYSAARSLYLTDCLLFDDLIGNSRSWTMDADVDLIFHGIIVAMSGTSKVNGFSNSGNSWINGSGGGADSLEQLGIAYDCVEGLFGLWLDNFTLKISFEIARVIGCVLRNNSTLILNFPGLIVEGLRISGVPLGIAVDVLAGADRCVISGIFGDNPTAAIRTAAQRTVVHGSTFASTGANKTILEAGAADRTLVTGCNGISTGGGFSVPGANSLVGADNIG